jgi:hypothetical protein
MGIEYKDALRLVGRLVSDEFKAGRNNDAHVLLRALMKLCEQLNCCASEFVSAKTITRLISNSGRVNLDLERQFADPASEVTPELFIYGMQKALLKPVVCGDRPSFEDTIMKMWAMQRKKGADYGSDEDPLANLKDSESYGIPGWLNTFARINDKRMRIISFITKGRLINEKAYDAFQDFAVYAVHMWRLFCEWQCREARKRASL